MRRGASGQMFIGPHCTYGRDPKEFMSRVSEPGSVGGSQMDAAQLETTRSHFAAAWRPGSFRDVAERLSRGGMLTEPTPGGRRTRPASGDERD